jgi:probable DNA repair protein
VGIDSLMRFARDERRASACPLLLEQLGRLRARARESHGALLAPSAWGPRLQALLAAMGWPGERALDSEEFQTVEAWRGLLTGLAHLDLVHGAVGFDSVRAMVRRLATQRLFQPQSPPVPVQVLGVLESAGLEFDHLWVMGLHAEAWPRAAHPNPLLPIELQRRLGIPGGCPEWELGFAQRMREGWRRAAPRVLFSYPQAEDDRALLPSPLLAGLPRTPDPLDGAGAAPGLREVVRAACRLEEIEDIQGQALPAGVAFSGGARLIQDQAACPFRAFAVHRLGARSLEQAHEGLDARERGNLLHGALAALWEGLHDSDTLLSSEDAGLRERAAQAVEHALSRWQRKRGAPLAAAFLALERERLQGLLVEWLALERSRGPFEVIGAEHQLAADVGGLHLELRADRVDRLLDGAGAELLIDYKTGDASVNAWFGERPDEPQLPLYALARDPPPAGLAFARVARGQCGFAGLAATTGETPGVKALTAHKGAVAAADWPAQLAQWRVTLDALAQRFRTGPSPVLPKAYPLTCRYCDLGTLCRVSELREAVEEQREDARDELG